MEALLLSNPLSPTSDPKTWAWVLPDKLFLGMQPAAQNPYPIYDQNLWFSLAYLPEQEFDTVSMAVAAGIVAYFMKGFGWWPYRFWPKWPKSISRKA